MDELRNSRRLAPALAIVLILVVMPVYGQTNPPTNSPTNSLCTGAMVRSFSSCISFLSSGSNMSSPTRGCCESLKSLMSNGQNCLCLIVTGGVPFQVPFNRTLAVSLPRACRMSGVPVECKGSPGSPIPAPGPSNNNPLIRPPPMSPPSPIGPTFPQPFSPPYSPPGGDNTPPFSPGGDNIPTLTPPGMRPTLTPSAAQQAPAISSSLLVAVLGVVFLKLY